ncbi:DUF1499 domain-containing protein [Candidatus Nitronereus thalassa]|uniref:DUF1499 domain-containing protein n=1 Tax=Candidatus Nitronereus thalassa TaxID=3020898 RepID=A0ABU3K9Y2_9BACT|nr:DUF1499 domain-containing protein [Candidatus Nitronereus thalassa]MDT7043203.1 DUF1499 domain-containing protein [Candidatus Nitronereus thalassa]
MSPPAAGNSTDKRLAPCPSSPNCVSSQSKDPDHYIDPLAFHGSPEDTKTRLKHVLTSLPRTIIVEEGPTYLRAESTSLIFRFTDDLDFVIDAEQQLIHVRSASRVGYSDLGANRKRIEAIRQRFHRQP